MDCEHVDRHHVAERYVLNQLTPEEAERFEDHYMSCDACVDHLERAELMARGFKRAGAEEIAAAGTLAAGVAWWRRRRLWISGAAAALAVAVALPFAVDRPAGVARGNVPVVYLQAERDTGTTPSRRLRLPAESGPIVLALELAPPFYPSYVATVERGGRRLLEIDGLTLGERDTVTLSLDSSLLAAGDHLLNLEGIGDGGRRVAAGRFAFRVLED